VNKIFTTAYSGIYCNANARGDGRGEAVGENSIKDCPMHLTPRKARRERAQKLLWEAFSRNRWGFARRGVPCRIVRVHSYLHAQRFACMGIDADGISASPIDPSRVNLSTTLTHKMTF